MGNVVGCDISKDWFDVAELGDSVRQTRLQNEGKAIRRFARDLPEGSFVGMEATGQMHELLAGTLVKYGHTVFVVNPRWIHRYGQSVGVRGKSDRADALLIARYVAATRAHLRPYRPPTPEQEQLRQLLLRRASVVRLRMSTRQSLGTEAKGAIQQFNQMLKRIDQRIAELIRTVPGWRELLRRLQTAPGVGPIVAAYLVQVLTRFEFANSDAFVAHTGLDPRANDSGKKRGRRWLTHHGDSTLRALLFLAAMAASKRGECWTVYQANRQKGLARTAALVVLARKLARIAYALFKTGQTYDAAQVGIPKNTCIAS
jgi:transposase